MARAFRFRLETVRRIRKQEQEAQRREMAKAVQALNKTQENIASVNDQLRLMIDETREVKQSLGSDTVLLRHHQLHRDWLHRKIREGELELVDRRKKLAVEQEKFTQTRKRLNVIEKLWEKQWKRYQRELNKELQNEQDEAAQQLYHRAHKVAG